MNVADFFQEMRVGEFSEGIGRLFPNMRVSAEDLLAALLQGRLFDVVKYLFHGALTGLGEQFLNAKTLIASLLVIGMIGAVVMQFSDVMERFQVTELCFYYTYLLQVAILTRCFWGLSEIAREGLENVCLFIRLLMPTYLFAVGISTGSMTANAGYQMVLLLVYGVESMLLGVMMPLIKCYFLLAVLEGLQAGERLETMLDLLKKGIQWVLKGTLGIVAGLSFLQAILAPAIDKLSGSAFQKMIAFVPGIGDGAEGVIQLAVSSANLIKSGMGILLTLFLILFCLTPLTELFVYSFILKLVSAILGIISDKRMTKVLGRAGETGFLLLGSLGEAMLFFLMTMAATTTAVR